LIKEKQASSKNLRLACKIKFNFYE